MGSKILGQIGLDYVGMGAKQARGRTDSIVCILIPTSKFLPGLPLSDKFGHHVYPSKRGANQARGLLGNTENLAFPRPSTMLKALQHNKNYASIAISLYAP